MRNYDDTPLIFFFLAWVYALFSKKPKRCEDCRYNNKIYDYKYCYTEERENHYENYCLHPLKQSAHRKVEMKNGKCRGFKRKKK